MSPKCHVVHIVFLDCGTNETMTRAIFENDAPFLLDVAHMCFCIIFIPSYSLHFDCLYQAEEGNCIVPESYHTNISKLVYE